MADYQFIRELNGHSIKSALRYIETRQATVNRIPVNVFRNVLTDYAKNINIKSVIKSKNVIARKESLQAVTSNVFQISELSTALKN